MHTWKNERRLPARSGALVILLLLVACTQAGCFSRLFGGKAKSIAPQVSASSAQQPTVTQNVSVALQPASGYGGLYVQVSGEGWPQNMMVLVTLEDAQGRSETLAASDTDQTGKLNTGFLVPIDERWLASASPKVVTTTADGSIEAKADFEIVPPGAEVAMTSPLTTAAEAATDDEELDESIVLPLVTTAGVQKATNPRTKRSSSTPAPSALSGEGAQVDFAVMPGGSGAIDCRNGGEWITVVILSGDGFDATAVDPGSVTVFNGALSYRRDSGTTTMAAFREPEVSSNLAQYTWRWQLDDVNGDGAIDMVMEFRLDYTELTCDAAVVAVKGRTTDGRAFEGANQVATLVLEQS